MWSDARHDVGEVEPAREVIAVREDHADAQLGVTVERAVGQGELLEHGDVGGVALVGTVEADEQHVPVALDGNANRGLGVGHARQRSDATFGDREDLWRLND